MLELLKSSSRFDRVFSALAALLLVWAIVGSAPASYPRGSSVTIDEGATLGEIAALFQERNIVRSADLLEIVVTILGGEHSVFAGTYFLHRTSDLLGIALMIVGGDFGISAVPVTIPEGADVGDIAAILAKADNAFDEEAFVEMAKSKEGYLFPDTYFFLPPFDPQTVIAVMERAFDERLSDFEPLIIASGRSLEDIIIMASILEREARTEETRRTIAGILWKRLDEGIPLQVDATFDYVNGKNTFDLTLEDLDIDSPYNTYRYRGLPPGPIANPGLDAIRAALSPIETPYLYFLSDHNGSMHYSRTFEEHKQNKALYLR